MVKLDKRFERADPRGRTRRDFARRGRRDHGRSFARSLALIGSVGWPIVLLATGGAALGRYVDRHFGGGVRWSLSLLTLGTALGMFAAYRSLKGDGA